MYYIIMVCAFSEFPEANYAFNLISVGGRQNTFYISFFILDALRKGLQIKLPQKRGNTKLHKTNNASYNFSVKFCVFVSR
jgi:hypothetical protein